jgi:hypothetical protein
MTTPILHLDRLAGSKIYSGLRGLNQFETSISKRAGTDLSIVKLKAWLNRTSAVTLNMNLLGKHHRFLLPQDQ